MHLLDIPKPNRSPHRRYIVVLSLVFAACAAAPLLCRPRPRPVALGYTLAVPAKEASPVKYVTVTVPIPQKDSNGGIHLFLDTHKMPLIELYDELCWIETDVKKKALAGKMMPAAQEQLFLSYEKVFQYKYSLTPKQVTMIKRDGSRLNQILPQSRPLTVNTWAIREIAAEKMK